MRRQRVVSRRGQGEDSTVRDRPPPAAVTTLRVVRATHDQLRVEWSAEADPRWWQVVCWDGRDVAIARLKLSGAHRRATFAGLARLRQPFTIAVSGLAGDGSVLWQAGLADLYLRAARAVGQVDVPLPGHPRMNERRSATSQGRRDAVSPKRPKTGSAPGKTGKTRKTKPKKKTSRGK
jgi:hypothetical protein